MLRRYAFGAPFLGAGRSDFFRFTADYVFIFHRRSLVAFPFSGLWHRLHADCMARKVVRISSSAEPLFRRKSPTFSRPPRRQRGDDVALNRLSAGSSELPSRFSFCATRASIATRDR